MTTGMLESMYILCMSFDRVFDRRLRNQPEALLVVDEPGTINAEIDDDDVLSEFCVQPLTHRGFSMICLTSNLINFNCLLRER